MAATKEGQELMELDFYEILKISMDASDSEIKKSYRKAALVCHPDKNPDNPKAAAEFHKLQKIFEILEDAIEKSKYDKLLKGRKLAAIRARERSAHSQKLKSDLERREKEAAEAKNKLSDADRLAREVQRLKEEGDRLIAEESELMQQNFREEKKRAASRRDEDNIVSSSNHSQANTEQKTAGSFRVKVKWVTEEGEEPYSKEQIQTLFYKWGELNGVAVKQKGQKGTALVDYKEKSGADMAVQFEKGFEKSPLTINHLEVKNIEKPPNSFINGDNVSSSSNNRKNGNSSSGSAKKDYESLADMHKRRQNERARLIAEMLRSDGVND